MQVIKKTLQNYAGVIILLLISVDPGFQFSNVL